MRMWNSTAQQGLLPPTSECKRQKIKNTFPLPTVVLVLTLCFCSSSVSAQSQCRATSCAEYSCSGSASSCTSVKQCCETAQIKARGCSWKVGAVFGGTCSDTPQPKAPSASLQTDMKKCNTFGTWTVISVGGGKEKCEEAKCKWLPGNYSGGSCVDSEACISGNLDAEANALFGKTLG